MNTLLASMLLFAGDCQAQVVQTYVAPVVAQPVAYVYADPYWTYSVGQRNESEARLRKLEQIAEQNQQIIEQLRSNQTAPASATSVVAASAKSVLDAKCVRCHAGESAKGDFRLDRTLDAHDKLLIEEVVRSGQMPPKPERELGDEDYAKIQAWAREDSKAVRAALKVRKTP